MRRRHTPWLRSLLALAGLVGLALAGHWVRRPAAPACALDGANIEDVYRVEVVDARGHTHVFCCPRCARIWLEHQTEPSQAVTVTDETSGQRVDATAAYYVRSSVVTAPATGNRIHVFRTLTDAERHAGAFGGVLLPEAENPFHR
jgi:hypothetical protein